MKRCPGAVSSRTNPAASNTSSAMNKASNSLTRRRGQSLRRRRCGVSTGDRLIDHLEGLPKRDSHRDAAVVLARVQRSADVDPDRAEARIIANAETRTELPVLRTGPGLRRQGSAVEKRDDPEIAAKRLQPDPGFDRKFGEAAPADRVAVDILGPNCW